MDAPLTVAAFVVGITQWAKDAGVQGQWLKLVALCSGILATAISEYQPILWSKLSYVLVAASVTGVVSFVDDRLQRMKESPEG